MNIFLLSDTNNLNKDLKEKISQEIEKRKFRIAYISSVPQGEERPYFHITENDYRNINSNVSLEYFDLSDEFNKETLNKILNYEIIHLSGGSTYTFLESAQKRNLKELLDVHLSKNGLVIGVSAGAILLTKNIDTSLFCGDVNTGNLESLNGMSFVDFCFLPHLGNHYTNSTENLKKVQEFSNSLGVKIYICSDSDGIFCNDSQEELVGNFVTVHPQKSSNIVP